MFSTLGVRVTVIDKRSKVHNFVDAEIIDSLVYQMRQNRRTVRLGEEAKLLDIYDGPKGMKVRIVRNIAP